MTTKDVFSFCESITASGTSPWHLRVLTEYGHRESGGIDSGSLCGLVKPPKGWDLAVPVTDDHLDNACKRCVAEYRKLHPAVPKKARVHTAKAPEEEEKLP